MPNGAQPRRTTWSGTLACERQESPLVFTARSREPRHDRAGRNLRDIGYFVVGQTFRMAQQMYRDLRKGAPVVATPSLKTIFVNVAIAVKRFWNRNLANCGSR